MQPLDPASLIMCTPEEAWRSESAPPSPACPALLDEAPEALETEVGTISVGLDGIARVRIGEGRSVDRVAAEGLLGWLNARCPDGMPMLVDKRKPYALDFSGQQAIHEQLRTPAVALLIPALDKMPLAEYARETYLRHVETRIFRSEVHALRWLATFVEAAPYLPVHDLIQPLALPSLDA